jgi:hypothetical protein
LEQSAEENIWNKGRKKKKLDEGLSTAYCYGGKIKMMRQAPTWEMRKEYKLVVGKSEKYRSLLLHILMLQTAIFIPEFPLITLTVYYTLLEKN